MIRALLLHHNFIKIASCFIGYTCWAFLAQYQTATVSQPVTIYFYQAEDNLTIAAPDFITVSFSGKRKHVYLWNQQNSAIHLDASLYGPGKHFIPLSRENIFLPDAIKLEKIEPTYIECTITEKTT